MPDTAIELPFADGTYRFWLPLPQIVELERKSGDTLLGICSSLEASCGVDAHGGYVFLAGPGVGTATLFDTIRLALIGGSSGMVDGSELEVGASRARELVEAYCHNQPIDEAAALATAIVSAAVRGVEVKKKRARRSEPPQQLQKGQLIANCGQLGLNWERTSLSGYIEALDAHNTAHEQTGGEVDTSRLAQIMKARKENGAG